MDRKPDSCLSLFNFALLFLFLSALYAVDVFADSFHVLWRHRGKPEPPPIAWCEYGNARCERICARRKLSVVLFTAVPNAACQKMDEATFADPRVRERLASYGMIRIDVDRRPDLVGFAGIHALPTVIVMDGCGEFMRVSGGLDPDSFLGFLDAVEDITKD